MKQQQHETTDIIICPLCSGNGNISDIICEYCDGMGRILNNVVVTEKHMKITDDDKLNISTADEMNSNEYRVNNIQLA